MFDIKNDITNNYIKIVPLNIEEYLTPLALALWFMDDTAWRSHATKLAAWLG